MNSDKKTCLKLLNITIIILTVGTGVFISLVTPYPSAGKITLLITSIISVVILAFCYKKYKTKDKPNKIMLSAEIICTVLLFLLYIFGYERFTPPNAFNLVFVIFSLVLFFPVITDIALIKQKLNKNNSK